MRKRKGSILMFTIVIMLVGVTLAMTLMVIVRSDIRRSKTFNDNYSNYYLADSGINAMLKYIDSNEGDFINWFEGEGKELNFDIDFPNVEEPCVIDVTILDSNDLYSGFMQIKSTVGSQERYYILIYDGSSVAPIKYIER